MKNFDIYFDVKLFINKSIKAKNFEEAAKIAGEIKLQDLINFKQQTIKDEIVDSQIDKISSINLMD